MALIDGVIGRIDRALRTFAGITPATRPSPGAGFAERPMDQSERRHSAGLMRVNHVGEVCAQALYDSQGRFSKNAELKRQFAQAGLEEEDHLAWTAQRLRELGARTSLLNPFWYAGAYALGALAAYAGDAHSLGFVVETERQVEEHLTGHLDSLPLQDEKSRAIVDQMRIDEIEHAERALASGAAQTPLPVRMAMRAMAKVMTTTAYYI